MNNTPVQLLAPVTSNQPVYPGVNIIWLEAPEIARIALPGQFVMLKCEDGTFLRRPLSIHRVSTDRTRVAFMFAAVGKGTAWLAAATPRMKVDLLGPLGNHFEIDPDIEAAVVVAGGLGVAPLAFLADELKIRGKKISFLYGAATAGQLCPEPFLPEMNEYILATEDGSRGERGFITACLPRYLSRPVQLFACGPTPMYRTMAIAGEIKNMPAQVSLEVRMACGLGICYGCTVDTRVGLRQVCKHGPVFELHEVRWESFPGI